MVGYFQYGWIYFSTLSEIFSIWLDLQVWTEEGEEESEMTCSERLQAELQDDPGGGPPLIPVDPPDPPASPREQELAGETLSWTLSRHLESGLGDCSPGPGISQHLTTGGLSRLSGAP